MPGCTSASSAHQSCTIYVPACRPAPRPHARLHPAVRLRRGGAAAPEPRPPRRHIHLLPHHTHQGESGAPHPAPMCFVFARCALPALPRPSRHVRCGGWRMVQAASGWQAVMGSGPAAAQQPVLCLGATQLGRQPGNNPELASHPATHPPTHMCRWRCAGSARAACCGTRA